MVTGREFRHLAEHHLESLDAGKIVAQATIAHRRSGLAVTPGFGVAQPDAARLFKIRRQHHVQQSSLAVRPHLRHADNGIGKSFPGLPALELPALKSDQ